MLGCGGAAQRNNRVTKHVIHRLLASHHPSISTHLPLHLESNHKNNKYKYPYFCAHSYHHRYPLPLNQHLPICIKTINFDCFNWHSGYRHASTWGSLEKRQSPPRTTARSSRRSRSTNATRTRRRAETQLFRTRISSSIPASAETRSTTGRETAPAWQGTGLQGPWRRAPPPALVGWPRQMGTVGGGWVLGWTPSIRRSRVGRRMRMPHLV
ncbi:hypothetical protein LZ30DRAFT_215015 [Colletotrichum cereale]|nr:hypothetical protein LZ30DRAFT_215015 [Colletotrichum cereale]